MAFETISFTHPRRILFLPEETKHCEKKNVDLLLRQLEECTTGCLSEITGFILVLKNM